MVAFMVTHVFNDDHPNVNGNKDDGHTSSINDNDCSTSNVVLPVFASRQFFRLHQQQRLLSETNCCIDGNFMMLFRRQRKQPSLTMMLMCLFAVVACIGMSSTSAAAEPVQQEEKANLTSAHTKKRFSVLRVHIGDQSQLDFLMDEFLHNSARLDFWKEPSVVGEDAHVMIARGPMLDTFRAKLREHNVSARVMIDDVSELIKRREREANERDNKLKKDIFGDGNFRQHDEPVLPFQQQQQRSSRMRKATAGMARFSLGRYKSFADVIHYLNALAINFPTRVQVQPIGTTHEGRQIPLIKIGTNTGATKPAIWIDGGIHAREWVSPAAVLFMIDQLVTGYDSQPMIRHLVDQLDWYIVPLVNPDGYEFSRSSTDPEVRLWRKNRSPMQCTQVSTGLFTPPSTQCCQGVDLNRNFDWFFGQVGSSSDPCSEIYAGSFAFSEPETRSIRDFISQQQGRIKTFMTFHSYSQILMYPFGHALRTYPQDVEELSDVALRAAQALQSTYGTKYTVGTGADTLYPASGGSEDWAKGRMGVKYSFLFELRPEDSVYDGFLLPESQIVPTARETWEAVKVIATSTLKQFPSPVVPLSHRHIPHSIIAQPPPSSASSQVFPLVNGVHTFAAPGGGPRGSRTCRDVDPLCAYWTQQSPTTCHQWAAMRERCTRTCGFCIAALATAADIDDEGRAK